MKVSQLFRNTVACCHTYINVSGMCRSTLFVTINVQWWIQDLTLRGHDFING